MATSHGSNKWKLFGGGVEVVKLPNSRFRIVVRCQHSSLNNDYYYVNKDSIFKEFGDLYSVPLKEGDVDSSWRPQDGEAYPDMVLTGMEYSYPPQVGAPLLEFTYETLTTTWTNVDNNTNPSSVNGLRVLEQEQVAIGGTALPYDEDDIGVVTIEDGGKTLYLSAIEDESSATKGAVRLIWAEAGLIRKRVSGGDGELLRITWEFIAIETPSLVVGRVIDRNIGNFEGLQTLEITTMNAPDGSDVLGPGDSDKQVDYREDMEPWTRPGIAGINTELRNPSSSLATAITLYQRSPAQMELRAHIEVFMSASGALSDSAFDTVTGGSGVKYWNPNSWATLEGVPNALSDEPSDNEPNAISRTLRGFRAITDADANWADTGDIQITDTGDCKHGYVGAGAGLFNFGAWFGTYIASGSTFDGYVWSTASIVGGPERPEGKIWMIGLKNDKAFTDEDGVDYYRKEYVWSYIPDFDIGEDVFDDAT